MLNHGDYTTVCVLSIVVLFLLFLCGCSPKEGQIVSKKMMSTSGKQGQDAPCAMMAMMMTSDQERMFGPFPCWKTREGAYRYQTFVMRYLLNGKTRLKDTCKSWIAALYRDAESSSRYMLKFEVRHRRSESSMWQTEDMGNILFSLYGDEVHLSEQDECAKQVSAIDVSVCLDMQSRRYLKIKITDHGWYDELRTFIE